jgi:hypothetical protein
MGIEPEALVQKELIRTLPTSKIVNDEIIFVPSKATKAQHHYHQKIAYGGGNFVRCAVAKSAAY